MANITQALQLYNGGGQDAAKAAASIAVQLNIVQVNLQKAVTQQNNFNSAVEKGADKAKLLTDRFKTAFGKIKDYAVQALAAADDRILLETRVQTVLTNAGASEKAIASIKNRAAQIAEKSVYSDSALLEGAVHLTPHLTSTGQIESMMGTLADFAAGNSGGKAVSSEKMGEYAQDIAKALEGSYAGLIEKGVLLTDQQKQMIENGTAAQRALTISEAVTNSYGGLSEAMNQTPYGKVQQLKSALDGIKESIGAKLYPLVTLFIEQIMTNLPYIQILLDGISLALDMLHGVLSAVFTAADAINTAIFDNWPMIAPIILGIAAALLVYNAQLIASTVMTALQTALTWAATTATNALAAAHSFLNTVLAMNPIMLVVMVVIALIAVFYAVIAAVNRFAGQTLSATGLIIGAVLVAAAFIGNIVIALINGLIQMFWSKFVEPFLGIIEWVINAANGGFDSFGDAVANLIGQMIGWFLSFGTIATKILDTIFGSNLTAGLNELKDSVTAWGKNENAITLDRNAPMIDHRFNYGDAFAFGNDLGKGIEDKIGGLLGFGSDLEKKGKGGGDEDIGVNSLQDKLDAIQNGVGNTADNTAVMADSMDIAEEELKYLREIAERDAINRYTTAEITINQSNENHIASDMDVDGIVSAWTNEFIEKLNISAEGVHAIV